MKNKLTKTLLLTAAATFSLSAVANGDDLLTKPENRDYYHYLCVAPDGSGYSGSTDTWQVNLQMRTMCLGLGGVYTYQIDKME